MTTQKVIGHLAVDAGIVMLGDPCYTLPDEGSERTAALREWKPFCEMLDAAGLHQDMYVAFNGGGKETSGESVAAIVVKTTYGDGSYPVIAQFDNHGRITRVTIDFDPEESEALP